MESNLTFEEYINHLKFMETNVITDSSIHRNNNSNRTSSRMESSLSDDSCSTTSPEPVCRVSDSNNMK